MPLSKSAFGKELIIDLGGCNDNISDRKQLEEYVVGLIKLLKMKAYGKCETPFFGHGNKVTSGHSLKQFIETSSIVGHFGDFYKSANLNIFSCKDFDDNKATEFTKDFFSGDIAQRIVLERRMK